MSNTLASSTNTVPLSGLEVVIPSPLSSSIVGASPASPQMLGDAGMQIPAAADTLASQVGSGVDLIWRHTGSGQVLGWFLDELQVQDSQLLGNAVTDTNWQLKGTGDFNSDGQEDLLWHNPTAGQVVVWYMGSGNLERSALVGYEVTDSRWEIEGVGDFNQDGKDDILWRHYGSGQIFTWEMDGTGNVQQGRFLGTAVPDLNWRIEGIGDFNGDGTEDLLWRHYASGQNVAFHLNNQGDVTSSSLVGPVVSDLNWKIEGVGDFNGDGETDVLLRHYLSGQNLAWLMNNSTVIDAQLMGSTVADTQWQPIVSRRSLVELEAEVLETTPSNPASPAPETPEPVAEPSSEPDPIVEPEAEPEPEPEPMPVPPANQFNIDIDYSFDTNGWFTTERRAALEVAVSVWENIIQDDFATTSAGTVTPFVTNPQTGEYVGASNLYITKTDIDDLRIFVGARAMGNGTLGQGGASGYYLNQQRYVGDDFEPWLGSVSFNSSENWFFDSTPNTSNDIPNNQSDFISTAVHEIGHILGFNSSINAFSRHLNSAGDFAGPNAMANNGGAAIPLEGSHIEDGYEFGGSGEAVLDPISYSGIRQLPTVLDIAIFDDLGYEVDYSQASQNPSENRNSGISGDTGSNRLVAHDNLVPDCCSCNNCQSGSVQLALLGQTSLEEMIAG